MIRFGKQYISKKYGKICSSKEEEYLIIKIFFYNAWECLVSIF